MAGVTLNHTYTDGLPFSADVHNDNMTRSFAGTHAGGVDAIRMAGFNIERHMIMPDQAVVARTDNNVDSTCLYGDSIGVPFSHWYDSYGHGLSGDDTNTLGWSAVGGSGFRWYQPYDASVGMINWSFFMSYVSWLINEGPHLNDFREEWAMGRLLVYTRAILNGKQIKSSYRAHALNSVWPVSSGLGQPDSESDDWYKQSQYHKPYRRHAEHEAHTAQQYSFNRLLYPGNKWTGSTTAGVKRGWHELIVQVFLTNESDYLQECKYAYHKYGKNLRRHRSMLSTKADFGVRSARVVTFL